MSGVRLWSCRRCSATVPASPRATGPVRAASPARRALSSAAETSGPSTRAGDVDAGRAQGLQRLGDEGDEVVRAVGEGRVVEAAADSSIQTGSAPISRTSASATGRSGSGAVTPKQHSTQPVEVDRRAGEGHRRVQGEAEDVLVRAPARRPRARAARRVGDELAGLPRAGRGQPGDEVGQRVVGHGQHDELAPAGRPRRARAPVCRAAAARPAPRLPRSPRRRATTRWPARCRAAPSTAPTRPAPTTPTSRRAGRSSAEVTGPTYPPRRVPERALWRLSGTRPLQSRGRRGRQPRWRARRGARVPCTGRSADQGP